jgi:hypothetical protein
MDPQGAFTPAAPAEPPAVELPEVSVPILHGPGPRATSVGCPRSGDFVYARRCQQQSGRRALSDLRKGRYPRFASVNEKRFRFLHLQSQELILLVRSLELRT